MMADSIKSLASVSARATATSSPISGTKNAPKAFEA